MKVWESLLWFFSFTRGTASMVFIAEVYAWFIMIRDFYYTVKIGNVHLNCLHFSAEMKSYGYDISAFDMFWYDFPVLTLNIFCGYCTIMCESFFPLILYILIKYLNRSVTCLILDIKYEWLIFKYNLKKKRKLKENNNG